MNDRAKIRTIIHGAAVSAAGVGAVGAQALGGDTAVITPIQMSMIVAIAQVHGRPATDTVAADLILQFGVAKAGRFASQLMVGWMPLLGNAANATTAFALTQAIGWAADAHFSSKPN